MSVTIMFDKVVVKVNILNENYNNREFLLQDRRKSRHYRFIHQAFLKDRRDCKLENVSVIEENNLYQIFIEIRYFNTFNQDDL